MILDTADDLGLYGRAGIEHHRDTVCGIAGFELEQCGHGACHVVVDGQPDQALGIHSRVCGDRAQHEWSRRGVVHIGQR